MKPVKKPFIILISFSFFTKAFSQEDSVKILGEVTVKAFEQNRKQNSTTAAVKFIETNNADRNNKTSLVNGLNTVAGIRMEERSPGSYRINIRGSSLRSPFGVRNVKVYWNDIPITDPGGNTYFNQFAYNNFSYLEIFKGPAGSLYGAGTGGLILMYNLEKWQPGVNIEYITGSYNLQNLFASAKFGKKENKNQFTYAHNQSDGYRLQSYLRRDNFSWMSQVKISDKQELTASVLFTDMYYQTPGALTLTELNKDPRAARPASGGFPSAVNAKAAIFQKNILAGFTNQYFISSKIKNTTTLYGAFAQIKNPAIRNYERRSEPGYGARTVFVYNKKSDKEYTGQKENSFQFVWGSEFQQGFFNTQVAKNKSGNPDTLQTNDDIRYTDITLFAQADVSIKEQWFVTIGSSLNKTNVAFTRLNKYPVVTQSREYKNEFTPRISLMRKFGDDLSLLATISKGFSPPTIAELLPSTGIISTNLEAEKGWNYEMTTKYNVLNNRLNFELTGFSFHLHDALVQRHDVSGADYFINAGGIKEKGIELTADYIRSSFKSNHVFDYLIAKAAYTHSHFRYENFKRDTVDFSGKQIPSVPANAFSMLVDVQLKNGMYVNLTYYTASKIFLNDANTAVAKSYHLLDSRVGWKKVVKKKYRLNFYTGVDNLLDENYSLGNDINATGGRYYNAAPRRNYNFGVAFQWIKLVNK